ncbi:hypothetical protein C2E20_6422 [Micractinium conductrix]|uniref:Uncharacterized protein n=1 Tax=Micractinium conductrix TaxID=554055 RepID=A0A2P6V7N0_9CHLO|nr:hypothetical protein C2E20_6422 [Micractinium conductrix]|eukprot:PSC70097.1 hypothetical protein C2E20_6422 [Micractinium conductrix]
MVGGHASDLVRARGSRSVTAAAGGDAAPAAQPAAAPAGQQQAPPPPQQQPALRTCRRCKQQFDPEENGPGSCRYHSALWTGGEVAKAIGFCRESDQPEHQLKAVFGRTGLVQFWDCCGAELENAPGCCTGRHVTYDDPDD